MSMNTVDFKDEVSRTAENPVRGELINRVEVMI